MHAGAYTRIENLGIVSAIDSVQVNMSGAIIAPVEGANYFSVRVNVSFRMLCPSWIGIVLAQVVPKNLCTSTILDLSSTYTWGMLSIEMMLFLLIKRRPLHFLLLRMVYCLRKEPLN